jgi:hypothetical protein
MALRPALVASLLLLAAAVRGAELHTLKGDVIKGDIESLSDKEIVILRDGSRVATPLPQVLKVDFPDVQPARLEEKYIDVELVDGTLLHCKDFVLKEKQVELRTLAGHAVKLPLSAVANVLVNAADEKYRKDWTDRLARKRRRDVVAFLVDGVVNPLEGTLGAGDESGKTIEFVSTSGKKRDVVLANVHGLIFQRELDPQAPPVLCKVHDSHQDLVMASGLTKTATGLAVTTPAGAKIDFPLEALTRLDYTMDKIAFLSRLEPSKVVQTSNFDFIDTYRRDKNLDNGPLRVYDETYPIGLALHAHTELEYDLKGDYREFHALAGIDKDVQGVGGPVVLVIEGVLDGQTKEL